MRGAYVLSLFRRQHWKDRSLGCPAPSDVITTSLHAFLTLSEDSSDGAELPELEQGDGARQESIPKSERLPCGEGRHAQTLLKVIAVSERQKVFPIHCIALHDGGDACGILLAVEEAHFGPGPSSDGSAPIGLTLGAPSRGRGRALRGDPRANPRGNPGVIQG